MFLSMFAVRFTRVVWKERRPDLRTFPRTSCNNLRMTQYRRNSRVQHHDKPASVGETPQRMAVLTSM